MTDPRNGSGRSASVKDVAAAAGVSARHRVQRAQPARARQRGHPRHGCEQAIAELGFVRNESARQLRAGRSRTIAYLVLDAANPFFTDVARGIEEVAEDRGPLAVPLQQRPATPPREAAYLEHARASSGCRACSSRPVDPRLTRARATSRRGASPSCWSTAPAPGADAAAPSPSTTSPAASSPSTTCSSRGHRRIAFVGGPDSHRPGARPPRGRPPGAGARRPARRRPRRRDRRPPSPSPRAAAPASGSPACPRRRRPTAAFCANDLLALGLLQQADLGRRRRARRPGDRRLRRHRVRRGRGRPLTSVRQPRAELGRTAAELLLDEADNPSHVHQQVVFTPELVARRSTLA